MEYQLVSSLKNEILEVTLSGQGGKDSASEILSKISDLVANLKPKSVLIDIRSVQERLNAIDTYFLVKNYPHDVLGLKTAIIDKKKFTDQSKFLETVSVNVGYSLRFFTDTRAAKRWLKS